MWMSGPSSWQHACQCYLCHLSAPDPDVPLDLGAIVPAVYERGGYATRIDYRQPVPPHLLHPSSKPG